MVQYIRRKTSAKSKENLSKIKGERQQMETSTIINAQEPNSSGVCSALDMSYDGYFLLT